LAFMAAVNFFLSARQVCMKFKTYLDDPLIKNIADVLQPVAITGDTHIPKREGQRPATVLVPLVLRAREWQVLFTRRPMHLARHPGQIAFPGGRTEAGELPHEGALRETREEVGVEAYDVHLLGRLPSFDAVSEYRVTPFVGLLNPDAKIIPDPGEVEEVFELPFLFFMNKNNHIKRQVEFDNEHHILYDMPWPDKENMVHNVWGMTAMMMYRLYEKGVRCD